jgi:hypothetical protein
MTTDRFYGGVSNRVQNLRSMLEHIETDHPSREQLNEWVIANTSAGSQDAVSHHLTFLDSVKIIGSLRRNVNLVTTVSDGSVTRTPNLSMLLSRRESRVSTPFWKHSMTVR